jgi:RNA-directed DNA polymerase
MKWPRKKSLMKLKERVRTMTPRMAGRSLKEIVAEVNRTLRGGYGYFQHSKPNPFQNVDGYMRRRLRSRLQWRLDGRGKGIGASPPPLAERMVCPKWTAVLGSGT